MALPSLYSISTGKSIQTAFGGLNESYACAEAEFTEMKNFSSRGYPALQTRTPRRTMRAMGRCNGMYHLNGLLLCEGTTLRYTEDSEDDVAGRGCGRGDRAGKRRDGQRENYDRHGHEDPDLAGCQEL